MNCSAGRPHRGRAFIMIAAIALAVCSAAALGGSDAAGETSGSCGEGLTWTIDSQGSLAIEGSGPMYDYEPGRERWGGNTVRAVSIGDSVTSIGDYAFYECGSLTSAAVGDSVESIGTGSFEGCASLAAITVSGKNPAYSSADGVLFDKEGRTLVQYPAGKGDAAYTIPDSVAAVGASAFSGCVSLQRVKIPDTVESMGANAFAGCSSLEFAKMPDAVEEVASGLFLGCSSLRSALISGSAASIGDSSFEGCSSLESVSIPDSVTSIESEAFKNCKSLRSLKIPDSVTYIGSNAFYGCASLHSVNIPHSVREIRTGTFAGCSSLRSIEIPDSVTSVGICAFDGCSSLLSVSFGCVLLTVDDSFPDHVFYCEDGTTLLEQTAENLAGHKFVGRYLDWMIMQAPEEDEGSAGGAFIIAFFASVVLAVAGATLYRPEQGA